MNKIKQFYSLNFDLVKRKKKEIKFLVFHYTGMKAEKSAIKKLCEENSKVSCHYFIKKNGSIINLVPDLYISWHAGISFWKKFKKINQYSIGIEIHNPGHNYGYEYFNKKQIKSIKHLSLMLAKKYNIKKAFLGHSDIAPSRKKDPGEKFPWELLSKYNIGIWHSLEKKFLKRYRLKYLKRFEKKIIFKLFNNNWLHSKKKNEIYSVLSVVKAFQRRFRPKLINGKIDLECLKIAKNLVKCGLN